jgi:hypothetical protein
MGPDILLLFHCTLNVPFPTCKRTSMLLIIPMITPYLMFCYLTLKKNIDKVLDIFLPILFSIYLNMYTVHAYRLYVLLL